MDPGGPLDAVCGVSVSGHVEGLVFLPGAREIVGSGQIVVGSDQPIELGERGGSVHRPLHGKPFLLIARAAEEPQQRQPLAVRVAVDQRLVLRDGGIGDRAGLRADRRAQVVAREVARDLLDGPEIEHPVLYDRAAYRPSELLSVKIPQRFPVGGACAQSFQSLEVKKAAVQIVGPGLGDDVYDASRGPAELGAGSGGDDLEFLDGIHRDVDGGALPAVLLAEESVVVIPPVQADVVEDPSLAVEIDLVAVRSLNNADAGGQGEQVLKLAAEHGRGLYSALVQRGAGFCLCGVENRRPRNRNGLLHRRYFQRERQRDGLAHRECKILLDQRSEAGLRDRGGIFSRR